MTFHVGQKVVCVETWGYEGECERGEVGPVKGTEYTIREIGIGIHISVPDQLQVRLSEIANPVINYVAGRHEIAFRADRFRPVVERKTSIEIFTAMLNPSKQGVDA